MSSHDGGNVLQNFGQSRNNSLTVLKATTLCKLQKSYLHLIAPGFHYDNVTLKIETVHPKCHTITSRQSSLDPHFPVPNDEYRFLSLGATHMKYQMKMP